MSKSNNLSIEVQTHLPPISPPCRSPLDENNVTTNYTKFAEIVRRATSQQFQCSMFCGGKKCKYESIGSWSAEERAIPCLYSHWITDDILAMARPNEDSIRNDKLIQTFQKNQIGTIINLQESGEHASCGPVGLLPSGFTYDPKTFMDNQIYFYNFKWKDFDSVNEKNLLDMVKVVIFALSEGKVAIHCHAGLGRTGVLIAATLIYIYRCQAKDAIRFVRMRRPNTIQLKGQIISLFKFANYISPGFIVYGHVSSKNLTVTLNEFLKRQHILLHGNEARALRYIPKIIFIICEKLIKICNKPDVFDEVYQKNRLDDNYDNFTRVYISNPKNDHLRQRIVLFEPESFECSPKADKPTRNKEQDFDDNLDIKEKLNQLIESLELGDETTEVKGDYLGTEIFKSERKLSYGMVHTTLVVPDHSKSIDTVIDILVNAQAVGTIKQKYLYDYQKQINNKPTGWERLCEENNIETLSLLLWSWFENLDVPILSSQMLNMIMDNPSAPIKCFNNLELETRYTLEYMLRFVRRLQDGSQSKEALDKLMARLVASLTIKRVQYDGQLYLPKDKPLWTELTSNTRKLTTNFLVKLMELIHLAS